MLLDKMENILMGKATHENYPNSKEIRMQQNSVIQNTISASKQKPPAYMAINSITSISARKM
jgi:hypothetical protein